MAVLLGIGIVSLENLGLADKILKRRD